MSLSKYKRWGVLLHRVIAKQQTKKEQWVSTKMWRTLIYRMITKQRVKNEHLKRKHLFYVSCK